MLMKIKKLLVLSILSLMGTSAWAEVPAGIWSMPEPQGLEFTTFTADGEHYILYNPVAKMFFASGNGWNTMASLRTFGNEIWVESSTEADAPEGSYELYNDDRNPARGTGVHNMFTDDGNSTWVDHGTQGNYSWSCEITDAGVRFANVALIADKPEFTGMYLGWDGVFVTADNTAGDSNHRDAYTAILRHISPDAAGASVDWKAVTVESYEAFAASDGYEAYTEGVKTYIASIGLKEAIEAAEALNIDAAAALAIYGNTASKAEEMAKAQADLTTIIEVKSKLKAAIEEYEGKGFTATDAAKAVLNDAAATKAQVEKAQADLDAAFIEWGSNQASVANPVDMTSKIKNAHFDNGDCTTGWTGDAFGRGGTVSDGAEHYSKNYNTHQTITGLTPGIYAVGVYGYYRAGNYNGDAERHFAANDAASKYAKLYGQVGESYYEVPIVSPLTGAPAETQNQGDMAVTYTDPETQEEVTVYVPNTMATGDYFIHTLNLYANKLFVAVDESGELTIGVKKETQIDGDWSFFDDFSLTYYGAGADAYQLMLDEALKNFGDVTIDEGTPYTESYLTAYKEALAGDLTASNQAEVDAIFGAINGSYEALMKNIDLWKTWQKNLESAYTKYTTDPMFGNLVATGALADYYEMDDNGEDGPGKETIESELALTNEELEAEIARVAAMVDAIETEAKEGLKEGTDVTVFMKNPDFEDCDVTTATGEAPGWTVKKDVGNVTAGPLGQGNYDLMVGALGKMNYCFESWHSHDFDVYQEVTGAPEGVYVIEAQGYVRCENTGYVAPDEVDPAIIPIHLYMNNSTDVFPSVYSELAADLGHEYTTVESWTTQDIGGNLYPNSMGGAAQCFEWGMYKMSTYGLVKAGDVMRIGVKGKMKTDDTENWWCIWDNFKLTYQGYNVNYVQPALEKAMAQVNSEQPMGKSLYAQATGLEAKAEEAKASGDGKTMFQMLADITDIAAAITKSVETFAKLQTAAEALADAAFVSTSDAKGEASALASSIIDGIASHSFDDAEVDDLMEQIAVMNTKLLLPNNMAEATDAAPVECTPVIKSASFFDEEEYVNTTAGWTGANGNLGNGDENLAAQAYEFWQVKFDMYQTIKGLPKGTYKVTVDAWCRMGGNDENYAAWSTDNKATMAFVYAVDGDSTVYSSPVANVMKGALTEDPGIEGLEEWVNGETSYFLPNTLISGWNYMYLTEDLFTSSVIAKVGDDGVLTVGIKKAEEKSNSWVVLDNFKLFYLGANSSAEVSGDAATAISTLETAPVKVEFYTVGGARISKPGKGVAIVKQTLSDGTVKMHKVIVK